MVLNDNMQIYTPVTHQSLAQGTKHSAGMSLHPGGFTQAIPFMTLCKVSFQTTNDTGAESHAFFTVPMVLAAQHFTLGEASFAAG